MLLGLQKKKKMHISSFEQLIGGITLHILYIANEMPNNDHFF